MGFFDKIKSGIDKFKEENKGFGAAMKRINSPGYCGDHNRKVLDGDFWNGSYISIEDGHAVIYGSNQEDYVFGAGDVEAFELMMPTTVRVSKEERAAVRYNIVLKDGKQGQFDIFVNKIDALKQVLGL